MRIHAIVAPLALATALAGPAAASCITSFAWSATGCRRAAIKRAIVNGAGGTASPRLASTAGPIDGAHRGVRTRVAPRQ